MDRLAGHIASYIDIGANVGEWSAALLERNPLALGIAVDASEQAMARLRERNLPNLRLVHAAVSDRFGEAKFYEESDAGEHSSLSPAFSRSAVPRSVRVLTVDELMVECEVASVDVLKIDAEGWDEHVLHGAQKALEEHRICVVQFEYNRPWADAGSTLRCALDLLVECGYTVDVLRPDGLESYDYKRFGEFFAYSNFVGYTSSMRAVLRGG